MTIVAQFQQKHVTADKSSTKQVSVFRSKINLRYDETPEWKQEQFPVSKDEIDQIKVATKTWGAKREALEVGELATVEGNSTKQEGWYTPHAELLNYIQVQAPLEMTLTHDNWELKPITRFLWQSNIKPDAGVLESLKETLHDKFTVDSIAEDFKDLRKIKAFPEPKLYRIVVERKPEKFKAYKAPTYYAVRELSVYGCVVIYWYMKLLEGEDSKAEVEPNFSCYCVALTGSRGSIWRMSTTDHKGKGDFVLKEERSAVQASSILQEEPTEEAKKIPISQKLLYSSNDLYNAKERAHFAKALEKIGVSVTAILQ